MSRRLACIAAVLLQLGASAAAADVIKLGTIAPKDSPYHDVIRDLGAAWAALSGGTIELRIYSNVGDEPDIVRKMLIGQLQASALSGGGLVELIPELRGLMLPMFFRSEEERRYVARQVHPLLAAFALSRGIRVLCWTSTGWLAWFTKEPVVTPEDLRRLAIFVWGGEIGQVDAWRDAGYRAVPLPATEIITALQSGLIGALSVPPLAALSFQWFGVANHMTDLAWVPLDGAVLISEKAWQGIDKALRPKLESTAVEACARLDGEVETLNAKAIEIMKKHGLTVHPVPAEAAEAWERTVAAHYPKIMGDTVPKALLATIEQLRHDYRARHGTP